LFLPENPQTQALSGSNFDICNSKELEFVDFLEEMKVLMAEKYFFILQQSFHVL
jgi:hypothetical protein